MHAKHGLLLITLMTITTLAAPLTAAAKPDGNRVGTAQSPKIKSGTKVNTAKTPAPAKPQNKPANALTEDERKDAIGAAVQAILESYSKQKATALSYCEDAMALLKPTDPEQFRANLMLMCLELYSRNDRPNDVLSLGETMRAELSDPKPLQSICFMEATALTKLNDWTGAREKYETCPNQDDSMILSNVAELYMIEGDSPHAVRAYQKSLEHAPDNPHAIFGLATALERSGERDKAKAAFLKGVETDSDFSYLKDAFFEPKAETDFQTAYRMYAGHRYKEAKYYLDKYTAQEERPVYKAHGQALLDQVTADLNSGKTALAAAYPVVLSNVRAAAISADARYLAFASLVRTSPDEYRSEIWSLDTETGKTFLEMSCPKEIIFDLAFDTDAPTLRALSTQHRYEADVTDQTRDHYIYENSTETLPVALTTSGKSILAITPNALLTASPWLNPYTESPLLSVPSNLSRVKISADNSAAILTTAIKTELYDTASQSLRRAFPKAFFVNSLAAHPQKNMFALGIQSGAALVDEDGQLTDFFATQGQVVTLAFAPSGRFLMTLSEHTAEIWRIQPEEFHEEK